MGGGFRLYLHILVSLIGAVNVIFTEQQAAKSDAQISQEINCQNTPSSISSHGFIFSSDVPLSSTKR